MTPSRLPRTSIAGRSLALLLALAPASEAQVRFRNIYDNVPVGSSYSVLTVVATGDGGYAVSGNTGSNAFLLKVDAAGATTFYKTYGIHAAPGLAETASGFVLAGEQASFNDPALLQVDPAGDPLSAHAYDQGWPEQGFYAVQPTPDGGYSPPASTPSRSTPPARSSGPRCTSAAAATSTARRSPPMAARS